MSGHILDSHIRKPTECLPPVVLVDLGIWLPRQLLRCGLVWINLGYGRNQTSGDCRKNWEFFF
jgi:hypothetical protein